MNICCSFCGALHWLDERVSSSRVRNPEFGMCCAHGKVKLAPLHVPPSPLYNLFMADTPQGVNFFFSCTLFITTICTVHLFIESHFPQVPERSEGTRLLLLIGVYNQDRLITYLADDGLFSHQENTKMLNYTYLS